MILFLFLPSSFSFIFSIICSFPTSFTFISLLYPFLSLLLIYSTLLPPPPPNHLLLTPSLLPPLISLPNHVLIPFVSPTDILVLLSFLHSSSFHNALSLYIFLLLFHLFVSFSLPNLLSLPLPVPPLLIITLSHYFLLVFLIPLSHLSPPPPCLLPSSLFNSLNYCIFIILSILVRINVLLMLRPALYHKL
jgi:hypothetical protein